ncbi:putative leader peptide [Streptomyces chartreusis]
MRIALFSACATPLFPAETLLSSRRHIDLQRVHSAACPTG